jgi:hypothetical protein
MMRQARMMVVMMMMMMKTGKEQVTARMSVRVAWALVVVAVAVIVAAVIVIVTAMMRTGKGILAMRVVGMRVVKEMKGKKRVVVVARTPM